MCVFPFFAQEFRGSAKRKTLAFFRVSLAFFFCKNSKGWRVRVDFGLSTVEATIIARTFQIVTVKVQGFPNSAKTKRGRREGDGEKKNVTTICDKRHDHLRHFTTICDYLYDNIRLFVPLT